MKREEFISELRENLLRRGFDQKTVEAEMIPVGAYLDETGMTDVDIPVSEMADEIAGMLSEKKQDEKPEANGADDLEAALIASGAALGTNGDGKQTPEPKVEAPKNTEKNKVPEKKQEPEAPQPAPEKKTRPVVPPLKAKAPQEEKTQKNPVAKAVRIVEEEEDESYSADEEFENVDEFSPVKKEEKSDEPGFVSKLILKLRDALTKKKRADGEDAAEYDDGKNQVLFWVIFAIAVPIVAALALVVVGLYVAFWIALALLMIGLIAGLIVFVFGGALIAIIGVIYGIIMLIKGVAPVGLFEIGLGVTVGAVVLFVGILVYNFAVRLIPYGMKMLAKLLVLALKRGKEGLSSVRKTIKSL